MSTPTTTTPKTISITTQKLDAQAELQAIIDGANALMPGVDPFLIAKRTVARADLFALLQKGIDAAKATKEARLALATAVAHEREVKESIKPLRSDFKTFAQGRFGRGAPELQQLGFVQNRRPKRSVKNAAKGVARAQATRKARGTAGRQQKAAVTGTSVAGSPASLVPPAATPHAPVAPSPSTTPTS
jgi:hypothetical protein